MLNDNERWNEFTTQLKAAGIIFRFAWEARRDGAKPSWPKKPADVGMVMFTGKGFQPSELTAIVIDYEAAPNGMTKGGFGLYFDSPTNSIAEDVARIAKPHERTSTYGHDSDGTRVNA